jgi:two-component system, sensor histidine kinase
MPPARGLTSSLASMPGLSELTRFGIPGRNRPRRRSHASDQGQIAILRARLADAELMVRTLTLLGTEATNRTELREANRHRDRAERDNRTKDAFMATLAHELRSPLGAISNAVRVLELTHAEGQAAVRAHEVVVRQVTHMSQLISDLLDVERVISGKIRLNRQPLDMAEAVRQAIATFTGDAHLDRQIDVCAEPVWVDADAGRFEQVLVNIVTNAVKYTLPGARIRVVVRAEGRDAVVSVADTGFGISPQLMPFIFDRYTQADRTLDSARGGMGIGLALVRRLVELHGGTIAAYSAGEDQGTTFTVRLARIPSASTPVPIMATDERCVRSRRVLLIEDAADARDMLRMTLQLAGHEVFDAADGIRGLEMLNLVRPDVGIVDIGLPRMDGYQVACRIRAEPHGRDILLVALTGGDGPRDAIRSLQHGFDHHLVKPVDLDYLACLLSSSGPLKELSL